MFRIWVPDLDSPSYFVAIAAVEYVILLAFSAVGLWAVFITHKAGTVHPTIVWLSPSGVKGAGSLVAGMLIAVYLFTGWDTAIYLNEETEQKETNPGKAAIISVIVLGLFYTLLMVALQGAAPAGQMDAHSSSALVFAAHQLAGSPWDKVMAFAISLSVIGTTQAFLVGSARIAYSMGSDHVIPKVFGTVAHQFQTPAFGTFLFGLLTIVMTWLYIFSSSVSGAFDTVVTSVGVLFALFYAFTGFATTWYYRKLAGRSVGDLITVGILPSIGAVVLLYIAVKSLAGFSGQALTKRKLGGTTLAKAQIFSDEDSVIVTIYFMNQLPENRRFQTYEEFISLRDGFIRGYTECVAKKKTIPIHQQR